MQQIPVEIYESPGRSRPVAEYILKLDKKAKKKVFYQIDRLKREGLALMKSGIFEKITGDLYELKIPHNRVEHRIMCGLYDSRFWLIHAFRKKEQKTRPADVSLALDRLKSLKVKK